jgi:enoyl-[acyl-carrier-protein] reductase (NADH)
VGILEGKNILVAGVTLDTSIGFHVAKTAQAEGATVVVSNFGRAMSLTARVIKKLDPMPLLLEVDVTNEDHLTWQPSSASIWTISMAWCIRWPSPTQRPRWAGSF